MNKKLTATQIRDLVVEKLRDDEAVWDGHGWFTLGDGKRVSRNSVERLRIDRRLAGDELSPAERKRRSSRIFRSVMRALPTLPTPWPADLHFEDAPEAGADISGGLPTDLTGMTFGRLTVVSKAPGRRQMWSCECSCGQSCVAAREDLRTAHKRSCGCFRREFCGEIGRQRITHGHKVGGRESPTHVT
jgi:hypothetical protein